MQTRRDRTTGSADGDDRGFTLVELLVVIAIISVLMSLMIPGLQNVRRMAWGVHCLSNLRQIGVGVQHFATDNRGRFPAFYSGPPTAPDGGRNAGKQWDAQIAPYLGMVPGRWQRAPTVFHCPASPPVFQGRPVGHGLSYQYNRLLGQWGVRTSEDDPGGRDYFNSGSMLTLEDPESTILAVEYFFYADASEPMVIQTLWPQSTHVSMGTITMGPPVPMYYRRIDFRHRELTHVLFTDLHVSPRERISDNPRRVGYFIPNGVRLYNGGPYYTR